MPTDPFASPAPSVKHVHMQDSSSSDDERQGQGHTVDVAATLANATAFAVTNSRVPSAISLGGGSGWSTPYSMPGSVMGSPMHSSVPLPGAFVPPNHSFPTPKGSLRDLRPMSSGTAFGGSQNLTKRATTTPAAAPPAPVMKSTLLPELLEADSTLSLSPSQTIHLPLSAKTPPTQPTVPKPWLSDPSRTRFFSRHRISRFLVYFLVLLGLSLGAMQCYLTWHDVHFHRMDNQPLCLVLDEEFNDPTQVFGSNGNGGTFWREVDMSGAGNGQFEMTTASEKNSYVRDGFLYLMPTLTEEEIGEDKVFGQGGPFIYNITGCTFNQTADEGGFTVDPKDPTGQRMVFDYPSYFHACSATANQSTGSIINPVQSARVSTRLNALAQLKGNTSTPAGSLRTGRLSIRARLPTGDWLWPALWLLPTNNTYGPWPASGEIDMVESRGNSPLYTAHGSNYVQGSLHFGLNPFPNSGFFLDGVSNAYSWWSQLRGPPSKRSFSSEFHEYVLEWTEDWLRIYVDTRLRTLLEYRFDDKPMFLKGGFDAMVRNPLTGQLAAVEDPWGAVDGLGTTGDGAPISGGVGNSKGKGTLPNGEKPRWNAPFDQDFYLIMSLGVGGTNGWFPDGQGDKPWLNGQAGAMKSFAEAKAKWFGTWPQGEDMDKRAMVIDSVKMWRHC